MGHITCQSQRDENEAIKNCPYSSVQVWKTWEDDFTGEKESGWVTEDQCGPSKMLSVAQDQCLRCKKIFTY